MDSTRTGFTDNDGVAGAFLELPDVANTSHGDARFNQFETDVLESCCEDAHVPWSVDAGTTATYLDKTSSSTSKVDLLATSCLSVLGLTLGLIVNNLVALEEAARYIQLLEVSNE